MYNDASINNSIIRIAIKYKHIKEVEYQDQERRHQEILNAIKQLDK